MVAHADVQFLTTLPLVLLVVATAGSRVAPAMLLLSFCHCELYQACLFPSNDARCSMYTFLSNWEACNKCGRTRCHLRKGCGSAVIKIIISGNSFLSAPLALYTHRCFMLKFCKSCRFVCIHVYTARSQLRFGGMRGQYPMQWPDRRTG